jgi:hypothetical protein
MAYIFAQVRKGTIPDIYVQDPKYFEGIKGDIKRMFGQGVGKIDRISIHIRRGDYTGNSFYVDLCQTDYYDKAIAEFPGEKFLVFCKDGQGAEKDEADREWCEANFSGADFEFASGEDEIEDFNKMASCKGHIMANSSFSWWASFIGGGKTVCPRLWFSSGQPGIPPQDNWIQI